MTALCGDGQSERPAAWAAKVQRGRHELANRATAKLLELLELRRAA
jgi:hypothetical protein